MTTGIEHRGYGRIVITSMLLKKVTGVIYLVVHRILFFFQSSPHFLLALLQKDVPKSKIPAFLSPLDFAPMITEKIS